MKYVLHEASTRGNNHYDWLKSFNTFSFGDYVSTDRMNFGVLRVLNDDYIAAGKGFNTHPHQNMEIISIPIYGEMEHKDNLGNHEVLKEGEVQMMSAGSGILHSEYNRSDSEINFLQIWIYPNELNTEPSYNKVKTAVDSDDDFRIIISDDNFSLLKIKQKAKLFLGNIEEDTEYVIKLDTLDNGMYFFVIDGSISIGDSIVLNKRDGIGIWETQYVSFKTNEMTRLLAIEVPMKR